MKIPGLFTNKTLKYSILALAITGLLYAILRLTVFPSDPVLPLLDSVYKGYLFLPESVANSIFNLKNAGVTITVTHHFVFTGETSAYQIAYDNFLVNWPKFLLYKNWSVLILVLVWVTFSPIRKKIIFTGIFIITHIISVIGGLYLLGITAPSLYEFRPDFTLPLTLVGTFFMFLFIATWFKLSKDDVRNTLQKVKINFDLPDRKINEILVLLFIFLALRSFVIQYFDFSLYIHLLLLGTKKIASLLHYNGYIEGIFFIGENGSLSLAKWCLGFITMFVFASMIYLTRTTNKKANWLYILVGIIFLHILNITRLVALFIIVQGDDGIKLATNHHEVYNTIIYILIFLLWILWWEFFVPRIYKKSEI